jgi:transcriptional regulator with XRE-family HTH domain
MKIKLKAARVQAGLTMKQAAEKIGCHVSTIGEWEKDPSKVTAKNMTKIAEAYGILPEYIAWQE